MGAQPCPLVETAVPVGVKFHIHLPFPFAAMLGIVAGVVKFLRVEQVARHQNARVVGEKRQRVGADGDYR